MAKGSRWLRLSVDWDGSEWLSVLSAESQLAWVKFLCYVKMAGIGGVVTKRSPLTLSRIFGIGEESVRKMLAAAELDGAILAEDGQWTVSNWLDYQDDAVQRMRDYRERKRDQPTKSEADVTNGDVTVRNVTADIDIDIDIDKNKPPSIPPLGEAVKRVSVPDFFKHPDIKAALQRFEEYRRQKGFRPWVQSTWDANAKKWAQYEPAIIAAAVDRSIENGWQGIFPEKLAKQAAKPIDQLEPAEGKDYVLRPNGSGILRMDANDPDSKFDAEAWFRQRKLNPTGKWRSA